MEVKSKLWYFENFSMLSTLSKQEMGMLDKISQMRKASKSQVIYFPEDASSSIYMLKAGKVKITRISSEGKEIIMAILGPGEIFGELAITGQEKREEVAEASEDTVLCSVGIEELKKMMAINPKFNFQITKLIGFRLKKIQSRFESLIFKSAEERIKSFIKELAEEYGKQILGNPNERIINLHLTHEDIAKLTATSRQTVTTVLNDLEKKGLLTYDRKSIFVKQYGKL